MARAIIKRRYGDLRKEFKKDMIEILQKDRSLAMAIILTRISSTHRDYIYEILHFFGTRHKRAYRDFCNERLIGKMLCGYENIYRTLHFSGYKCIATKYKGELPINIALGEVYGLCLKIVNEK